MSGREAWIEKAMALHRSSIVMNAAVMSSQALIQPGRDIGKRWQGQSPGTGDLDLPRLRDGEVNVLFQAICGSRGEDEEKIPLQGLELADTILTDILARYPDDFEQAVTVSDVRRIRETGKIAIILSMQAGQFLGGSVRALRVYRRLGLRLMTLTHAFTNLLCDSSSGDIRWNGLSEVGRDVLRAMGDLGIIPDITHATDKAARQVLELSWGPVVATHSNARALCCPIPEMARVLGADSLEERNISDELIRGVADTGGVVCVNFAPALVSQPFSDDYPKLKSLRPQLASRLKEFADANADDAQGLLEEKYRFFDEHDIIPPTLDDIADHIEYIAGQSSWDHVGIGTDWEGTGGNHPRDLEDVSKIPLLTAELLRRGHDESQIRKVLGENMLRVLGETEKQEASKS